MLSEERNWCCRKLLIDLEAEKAFCVFRTVEEMAFDSCKAPSSGRCKLCSVPWLPVLLGLVAIICTGIW